MQRVRHRLERCPRWKWNHCPPSVECANEKLNLGKELPCTLVLELVFRRFHIPRLTRPCIPLALERIANDLPKNCSGRPGLLTLARHRAIARAEIIGVFMGRVEFIFNVSSHFITLGWLHSKIAQYNMSDLLSQTNLDSPTKSRDGLSVMAASPFHLKTAPRRTSQTGFRCLAPKRELRPRPGPARPDLPQLRAT